jgi:hypothetical protein
LEKNFALSATKKNILTLALSENKFLNETKNHNPPSPPFKLNGRTLSKQIRHLHWFCTVMFRGRCGRDRMVVGFTTTCVMNTYHRSWRGELDTTWSDKVCQWLAAGRWFSPVSSTNKTDRHDITEILLKVASVDLWTTNVQFHFQIKRLVILESGKWWN